MYGSIGKLGITGFRCATNQAIAHCIPDLQLVTVEYLYVMLKALRDVLIAEGQGVAQQNISQRALRALEVKLPPLAEQHRILAKVDELMVLCDHLEAARKEREAARDRLAAASLARLNAPDPDTFQADARFALNVLPALSARPDQLKQLRQTILNLAVRGKLVGQDQTDTPATELLECIREAKVARLKETGDQRIRIVASPRASELRMDLPVGWAVESYENLFLFIDYRGSTPPKISAGVPLITAKNIRMGFLSADPREYVSLSTYRSWMTRGFPRRGDLFFTTEAPLGNVCLNDLDEDFALAQRVVCLQPYGRIDTRFFMYAMMSDVIQSALIDRATGMTAKGIKTANLKPMPLPVPPLAEQVRIVTMIDTLRGICDQLESSMASGEAARTRLLESVLYRALSPDASAPMSATAQALPRPRRLSRTRRA
jgi:type I restriction enzyme S subunit